MELSPLNSKGLLFYNICSTSSQLRVTRESVVCHSCLHFIILYFSLMIYSCHAKVVMETMTAVLTKWSAMLHDKAGVEWGWKGVRRRGKWPLIVTHWTHSTARVAIDGYLALRKAHGPCYSTWFPVDITPISGSKSFQLLDSHQLQGFCSVWKLMPEGQRTFQFSPSYLSFVTLLYYQRVWEVVKKKESSWPVGIPVCL